MEKNVIVYFGMGFLPENNAVACREQVFAKLVQQNGDIPVLVGIKKGLPFKKYEKTVFDGIVNYSLKYAGSFKDKIVDNFVIQKTIWSILEEIGIEQIKCLVMQDYQWLPMKQLQRKCEKNQIAFVADIMDWFTPTSDYSLPKNIFKTVDTYMRMHWFYPKLKNRIYISHKFAEYFQKHSANALVLPCTAKDVETHLVSETTQEITLTFAGSPGARFEKEKLDWIIQALCEINSKMNLKIIGITKEQCLEGNGYLNEFLTERIKFLGRISHEDCLSELQKSDFSIVVRQVNKLTTYGFSSKVCEAFAYGIPVIATDTSDNSIYIQNGINGYTCAPSYEALRELLKQIEGLNKTEITKMKQNLSQYNPLSMHQYTKDFDKFMKHLTIS